MLGRHHHGGRTHRHAALVRQAHLALGVGAETGLGARMAGFGEGSQYSVGKLDRGGHQLGGFAARIAEHHTLVAGALVLVAGGVDALGNVRRLGVHMDPNLGLLPMESVLFVPNFLDRGAGHVLDDGVGEVVGTAHLAGEDDKVGGTQGFDGDPCLGFRRQVGIDDSIGDAVADLVGMSFGNGFTSEKIMGLGHGHPLPVARQN